MTAIQDVCRPRSRRPSFTTWPHRATIKGTNQAPHCPRPRRCLTHSPELTSWSVSSDSQCRSWSPMTGSTKDCAARSTPGHSSRPTPGAACAASAARKQPRLCEPAVLSSSGAARMRSPSRSHSASGAGLVNPSGIDCSTHITPPERRLPRAPTACGPAKACAWTTFWVQHGTREGYRHLNRSADGTAIPPEDAAQVVTPRV